MALHNFKQYHQAGIAFRVYGQGPPIILFHPSPNNASMLHPFACILAETHTVICPDTPGYGLSDQLPLDEPSMTDYVDRFNALFNEIGLTTFAIYGSATGAQLAIRYGLEFPDKIKHLYLDNCAHFTDHERTDILKHYFPDLRPKEDGTHIQQIWEIATNLFKYFPWCFQTAEYRLNTPPIPIEIINKVAIDYLLAGKNYHKAYRAAFMHEKVEFIQQLKVDTTIMRWQGSILKPYTDRLFTFDLPLQVRQRVISPMSKDRYAEMSEYINQTFRGTAINLILSSEHESCSKSKLSEVLYDWQKPNIADNGSHLITSWQRISIDKHGSKLSLEERQKALVKLFAN